MSINKQRLREAAQEEIMLRSASDTSDDWQDLASPEAVLALLDELEAAEKRIAELEWDSEQAECVNLCLNELGVPQAKDEGQLSLWGRVVAYGEISATERDELRALRATGIIAKLGE